MNDGEARDWTKNDDKVRAIRDVLRHILTQQDAAAAKMISQCLQDNSYAPRLFRDIGKLEVPAGAKVVFLPAGDSKRADGGSLLLEPPDSAATAMSDDELLQSYVLSAPLPPPSHSIARTWSDRNDRAAAVVDVLRYLMAHPGEGEQCVQGDQHARGLFTGSVGKIRPPDEVKIVFLPSGQLAMQQTGSLVLEVPTVDLDDEALVRTCLRCCYIYW